MTESTLSPELAKSIEMSKGPEKVDVPTYTPGSAWSPHVPAAPAPVMGVGVPSAVPASPKIELTREEAVEMAERTSPGASPTSPSTSRRTRRSKLPEAPSTINGAQVVEVDAPRSVADILKGARDDLKGRIASVNRQLALVRDQLHKLTVEGDELHMALARIEGTEEPVSPQSMATIDKAERKARRPRRAKRASKGSIPSKLADLLMSWRSTEDIVKATGWKKTSVQPMLSKMRKLIEKKAAPTKTNPRRMVYKLK